MTLTSRQASKARLPAVVFEITARCNLRCRYCYNSWTRPGERPPFDSAYRQAMRTLRQLFRIADVGQVTMSGGEPLLSERFSEVVLFCRMKGKRVNLISNGNGGPPAHYLAVADLGVGLFEFPLHAARPEPHDALTGVRGSWARSRQTIQRVMAHGAQVVAVVVLTRVNAAEIEETLIHLHQLGIRRVMLNRFNIGGRSIGALGELVLSTPELRSAFAVADRAAPRLGLALSANVCTPICVLDPSAYPHIAFGHCARDPRQMPITIDLLGNLRLCNHSPTTVGNIFAQDIDSLFSSPYARAWQTTVPTFCRDCRLYSRCRGGCRAAAEQVGGTLADVDPIVQSRPLQSHGTIHWPHVARA